VIVTGYTESADFPVQSLSGAYNQATSGGNETYDAFIVKFNANGTRTWTTYYGGLGMEQAYGIAVDGSNNILITGQATFGLPLQTLTGAYNQAFQNSGMNYLDAFVLKFNSSGARTWATYYGGNSEDYGTRIATDVAGNILITGYTNSTNFPVQALAGAYNQGTLGGYLDAYIVKFSSAGIRQWATYYGGEGNDQAFSISTDKSNNILVCGSTEYGGLPTLSIAGGYNQTQGSSQGDPDGFILKFNESGVRQWATYYGNSDGYDELTGIAADNSGRVVAVGTSDGVSLPVQGNTGGYTQGNDYSSKAIIVQFTANGALATGSMPQTITFNPLPDRNYADGYITLTATASSGLPVSFTVSGPASVNGNELYFTGIGTVTVTASQSGNATYAAAPVVERAFCINASQPYSIFGDFSPCIGTRKYTTDEVDGATYNWTVSSGGTILSTDENEVTVNWTSLGNQTISVSLSSNCGTAGPALTQVINVVDLPPLGDITELIPVEGSTTEILPLTFKWNNVANATAYYLYVWPASINIPLARASNISDTSYTITFGLDYGVPYKWMVVAKSGCEQKESTVQTFTMNCTTPAQPSEISSLGNNCLGEQSYFVQYQSGIDYAWTVSGGGTISGFGSFATVNWITPGTYTITVTPSIACGKTGPSRTLQVTITDKLVPAVVNNMLPVDGATDLSMPLTLSWNAAANADKYDVYIWKDGTSKLSGEVYTGITTTSYTIQSGLEYGKMYRWQVVAKNDCKESESAVQTLTLNCIDPPQPSVISGETSVCPGKAGYSINGVQGVIYNWTVNNSAIITGVGTSVEVTFTNPGSYTITVTPSVGCGKTGPSRTLDVTVLNTPQPAAVTNMLPADGITTLTIPFDVSWSAAANATSYDLYIWKQTEGKPNFPFKAGLTATLFRVESGVEPGIVYNWQVVSKNTCKQTEGPTQTLKVLCPVPEPIDTINGLADVCPGEWEYSVKNSVGINYQWSVSGGGTIIGSGASIKVNWTTLGTHTLTVKPVAVCGEEGQAKTLLVEVKNPQTVGAITNMQPANNYINAVLPLNLSWSAAANADRYEFIYLAGFGKRSSIFSESFEY
ncbi:MAG TPA: SBBP repeat-containing protein, partial [Cytophagaceae bacterium]